ncbi:DUF3261 domain-containing protein [Grimontia sp. NTOU-MAR1]|uniref:DUF3261 domain-containing protein n=1 Tax=Grimontia sp. NTOU-MAR1 TaxID=3111011 RepID=UPI002DB69906|nr:DUF3261 domain-containing protein [Grimontia sp. NTOU-MAR1]WRV97170.1 DUF3261 domain-containing protein [Grimontia sp. NTOU-MAR1]
MIRVVLCLGFYLLLSACTAVPDSNHVEIAPDKFVSLPAPSDFQGTVSVNQLITAKWSDTTQVLPVHLEITGSDVVLVGFSSWGTRLLTINYDGHTLEKENLTGLGVVMPDGKQVLMNLMLTLWPTSSWQTHLSQIGWQLVDDAATRTLIDENGETVVKIQYDEPKVAGGIPADIKFEQVRQHYQIQIQTLE